MDAAMQKVLSASPKPSPYRQTSSNLLLRYFADDVYCGSFKGLRVQQAGPACMRSLPEGISFLLRTGCVCVC